MNAARPGPGSVLARLEHLPDPGAITLTFYQDGAAFSLILARRGVDVFAYENVCPHAGYQLQRGDGRLLVQEGRYLVCNAHGASFLLNTGACAGGPCNGEGLKPFAVMLVDGDVITPLLPDRD